MNITKITAFTPLKLVLWVHAIARNDTPTAPINALPTHEYSSHLAGVSLPTGRVLAGGSGFLSSSTTTMSSSAGFEQTAPTRRGPPPTRPGRPADPREPAAPRPRTTPRRTSH